MFYPNRLVFDGAFRVAENSEYLDLRCLPRLEYEATSLAIPGKLFFPRPLCLPLVEDPVAGAT